MMTDDVCLWLRLAIVIVHIRYVLDYLEVSYLVSENVVGLRRRPLHSPL